VITVNVSLEKILRGPERARSHYWPYQDRNGLVNVNALLRILLHRRKYVYSSGLSCGEDADNAKT
jgi:hypothetical protein